MDKMLGAAAYLPYPFIGFLPVFTQPLEEAPQVHPQVIGNGIVAIVDIDGVQQLDIYGELLLLIGTIADAHRCALPVSLRWSSVISVRSCSPSMVYMGCNVPFSFNSWHLASSQPIKASASWEKPRISRL